MGNKILPQVHRPSTCCATMTVNNSNHSGGNVAGKARTVYFYDVVTADQDNQITELAAGWWFDLFDFLAEREPEDLRNEFRRRKYEGEIRDHRSPAVRYLYLGKLRPGADWPDIRNLTGQHGSLASTGAVGAVIEPAYVVPIHMEGENYVAVLKSSNGPSKEALQAWLSSVAGYELSENRLILRPYARRDQLERLQEAMGASRIHLKVDSATVSSMDASSDVGRAIQDVQQIGSGGVSVELIVSFGNARPDDDGAEALVAGVRDIVGAGAFRKLLLHCSCLTGRDES
ncbi:hypothetical protein [Clavibacter tessellarius]|uniref:hypothetical protein n=1 Tax=Clavibacter tessellarius TaxID=31965 RepID=UPI003249CA12